MHSKPDDRKHSLLQGTLPEPQPRKHVRQGQPAAEEGDPKTSNSRANDLINAGE